MSLPPIDKTFAGSLRDLLTRVQLVERRMPKLSGSTVSSGAVAPTSTPSQLGDTYIRTDTGKVYIAVGTTSSADWALMN